VRVFDRLGEIDYRSYLFVRATTQPSVLLELGSHVHDGDRAILTSDVGRYRIVRELSDGLVGYARAA
jgi:N-acetylmuramoyl-L-alanine amidase